LAENVLNGETTIDLNEFPVGLYFLLLETNGGVWNKRVIKISL